MKYHNEMVPILMRYKKSQWDPCPIIIWKKLSHKVAGVIDVSLQANAYNLS